MHVKAQENILFIISGPSGVGKNTVGDALINAVGSDHVERVVTTTTRHPREGEINGKDYFFVDEDEFLNLVQEEIFLEHATVHGQHYGSSRKRVENILQIGKDALLIIDVNGVEQILQKREMLSFKIVTIFINLSDIEQLKQRIVGRGSETDDALFKRLQTAKNEMQKTHLYDYVVDSKSREDDLKAVMQIYKQSHAIV